MRHEGLNLLLAHTPHNVGYLTDYDAYNMARPSFLLEDGEAYYIMFVGIPRDEAKAAFMTPVTAEEGYVSYHDPWIRDRRFWGPRFFVQGQGEKPNARDDPVKLVAEALKERQLDNARIGVEMTYISAEILGRLRKQLPKATLVAGDRVLWKLRMLKSEEEISRMKKAARATESAIQVAFENARRGITELELERIMIQALVHEGAHWGWTEIGFGPKGAEFVGPSDRKLDLGEIVRIDAGGYCRSYCCDMSRVAVLGKPSEEAARYHASVLKTNERVRGAVKPGAKCCDLYALAAKTMRSQNCRLLTPQAGHSVGREAHERPFLTESNGTVLEPGMVITVEIPMRIKGVGSINIEDELLVTRDGNETLTNLSRELVAAG